MAIDRFPEARTDNDGAFRYPTSGPFQLNSTAKGIGGTYHVSTPIDPEAALTGPGVEIRGDMTPRPLTNTRGNYTPGN